MKVKISHETKHGVIIPNLLSNIDLHGKRNYSSSLGNEIDCEEGKMAESKVDGWLSSSREENQTCCTDSQPSPSPISLWFNSQPLSRSRDSDLHIVITWVSMPRQKPLSQPHQYPLIATPVLLVYHIVYTHPALPPHLSQTLFSLPLSLWIWILGKCQKNHLQTYNDTHYQQSLKIQSFSPIFTKPMIPNHHRA